MNPSMRLKVKGDTFFLPDPGSSVYFRNNTGSFRMEGGMIEQWIEKILPALDGNHTMEDLTAGLPDEYRNRVYEIAGTLYKNGFVRDVSEDRSHQLSEQIIGKYAAQIEFLDSLGGSGACRFQSYRQSKVLTIGSGPFLVSLIAALLESGLPNFHMLLTDPAATNRGRIAELAAHARKTDPAVELEELSWQNDGPISWHEIVQPFDAVLYVSQRGDVEQLRALHQACRETKKVLLPALFVQQIGMAGPVVQPDSDACWESAWRRLHRIALSNDPQLHSFSSTAASLLANLIVFEWFKTVTGVTESTSDPKCFLLNLETLEGDWHPFLPHPLMSGLSNLTLLHDSDHGFECDQSSGTNDSNQLLSYFSRLTSPQTGILHLWEEGDLKQLPLALCRVQAADPVSAGPAELLPEIICASLTHEEARREAGLAGIEAYVSRLVERLVSTTPSAVKTDGNSSHLLHDFVGVGAGETASEGILRGLQKCLTEQVSKLQTDGKLSVNKVQLGEIKDERCRFYLRALTTMQGQPIIGMSTDISGFPVIWVGTNGHWYGGTGLNSTLALRIALEQALLRAQHTGACGTAHALEVSSVVMEETAQPRHLTIPACEGGPDADALQSAAHTLARNGKRLIVLDLAVEPFMKEDLAGVFGVSLREEELR